MQIKNHLAVAEYLPGRGESRGRPLELHRTEVQTGVVDGAGTGSKSRLDFREHLQGIMRKEVSASKCNVCRFCWRECKLVHLEANKAWYCMLNSNMVRKDIPGQ